MHLNEEQCEDILAIESYLNWLQNKVDFDIVSKSRDDFDTFIMWLYDANKPVHLRQDFDQILRATQDCNRQLIVYTKHTAPTLRELLRNRPPNLPMKQRYHAYLTTAFQPCILDHRLPPGDDLHDDGCVHHTKTWGAQ